ALPLLEGAGVDFEQRTASASVLAGWIPTVMLGLTDGGTATIMTIACDGGACQLYDLQDGETEIVWRGRISLQRAAYTQLTEGGPLPAPVLRSVVRLRD